MEGNPRGREKKVKGPANAPLQKFYRLSKPGDRQNGAANPSKKNLHRNLWRPSFREPCFADRCEPPVGRQTGQKPENVWLSVLEKKGGIRHGRKKGKKASDEKNLFATTALQGSVFPKTLKKEIEAVYRPRRKKNLRKGVETVGSPKHHT